MYNFDDLIYKLTDCGPKAELNGTVTGNFADYNASHRAAQVIRQLMQELEKERQLLDEFAQVMEKVVGEDNRYWPRDISLSGQGKILDDLMDKYDKLRGINRGF